MKNRLDVLQRQRDLLREHLQWLEDEIASERARIAGRVETRAIVEPATPPAAVVPVPPSVETQPGVLPAPEPDIKGLHDEVRRGCLLYVLVAAGALGLLVAFIYWKYGNN